MAEANILPSTAPQKPKRWFDHLYAQVLIGIALGIAIGFAAPSFAIGLKPLGDIFIRLIKMMIGLIIFCTIVTGIGGSKDLKAAGKLGGKALLYFEIVSTLALLIGLAAAHLLRPGGAMNADVTTLDAAAVADYANMAKDHGGIVDFLMSIVPTSVVGAFANGEILPVVLISVLFGIVTASLGSKADSFRNMVDSCSILVFGVTNLIMRFAPLGAAGAMAYTVGKFGFAALGSLTLLILTFYVAAILFVVVILGLIMRFSGVSIFALLIFIKDELLITLGASSSDAALPGLMEKLEFLGCSRSVVGIVVPTGYVFNADGTCIYMTTTAIFIAQALHIPLSFEQQAAMFAVAMLTSKGASGVTGAGFIGLVSTLAVVPSIPVAGMALVLGIDRFMSEGRALVNLVGNAVATVVLARHTGELDMDRMRRVMSGELRFESERGRNDAVTPETSLAKGKFK